MQTAKSLNLTDIERISELYHSVDIKLNKILKFYLNSSDASDIEIYALILSIDVKLRLKMFDKCRLLIRQLDPIIEWVKEKNNIALSEVLKQFKYYYQAKFSIEEIHELKRQATNSNRIYSLNSDTSFESFGESSYLHKSKREKSSSMYIQKIIKLKHDK